MTARRQWEIGVRSCQALSAPMRKRLVSLHRTGAGLEQAGAAISQACHSAIIVRADSAF